MGDDNEINPVITEATECALKAVAFDNNQKIDAAVYFYTEAAETLINGAKSHALPKSYLCKAEEYIERAECLKRLQTEQNLKSSKSQEQSKLERAEFLLYQALDEDADGNAEQAINLYSEAIELCLTANVGITSKLEKLATRALDRAEHLKANVTQPNAGNRTSVAKEHSSHLKVPKGVNLLGDGSNSDDGSVSPSTKRKLIDRGADAYTAEELKVLKSVSKINGREYVPFMSIDLKEKFAYPVPFSDKDGKLVLAKKQQDRFSRWIRPDEFLENPSIIGQVDSWNIKQTIVSDCSFIASLAIAARYEKRFSKRLISNIIYPQNKQGHPVVNPCGKYMIKLNLNGVPRKVIIDDYLPMGRYGDLLCSFSNNRNELWVSLLEKAYMKVMGGYDFPGSNSNIDLHALTGWIPERITIRMGSAEFNADATFEKLFDRYHKGDCLVTFATGPMKQLEADRAGLVECHAYAMLDVRKVNGKQLFLLKNPWNHLRWKGRFSERDLSNWTPEMQKALNYEPKSAQQFDDGVFWIDYESVCHFFDVIYINWTPSLFAHTYCIHGSWSAGVGPARDLYNIGENPQFSLEIGCTASSTAVWLLLSRHIIDRDDFANNKEYIALLVYKNDGKRVFYPFDPPPYIDGVRINSPHYLCKMVLKEPGPKRFTLVMSQFEKSTTISYTLRVYSTAAFRLSKLESNCTYKKREVGEWSGKTAGGCGNYPTCKNNPIYQVVLENTWDENSLIVDLKGPKQYSVGLDLVQVASKNNKSYPKQTTQAFRPGFCVLSLENVPSGTYNVIPQTFKPAQEGPFFLNFQSSSSFRLIKLQ